MEANSETSVTVFESQTDQERLILLLRAHFITNVPWVIITVLLSLLPIVLGSIGILNGLAADLKIPARSIDGFVLIWYLIVFAFAFQSFLTWYFNIYILTDRRIIDFDFFQLLYKKISSAEVDKIEDVTTSMGGVAQVLFNYGDIHIQTAGTVTNFEFLKVANPAAVKKEIEQAISDMRR